MAEGTQSAERDVPDVVRENALAEIHNLLVSWKVDVVKEMGYFYGPDDAVFQELEEIFAVGPIEAASPAAE